MTGTQIITFFGNLIGREGENPIEEAFALQLLNLAKNAVEDWTEWEYLKKKVTLSSASAALPANFKKPSRIVSYKTPVHLRPYDDYEIYEDGFYINYEAGTINRIRDVYPVAPIMTYIKNTDDITTATEPLFPGRFHLILAYEMAIIYQSGIDGDDLNFRMSKEHQKFYERLKSQMLGWDFDLKKANMGDIMGYDYRYTNNEVRTINVLD